MKRLLAILLLLLLAFQTAGYFAVFRLMQSGIRKEVFHQIESGREIGELVELLVPNDRFRSSAAGYSMVGNREIVFRGLFYDIVRCEPEGHSTRYFCYVDNEESELADQVTQSSRSGKQDQASLVSHLVSLTLSCYLAGTGTKADPLHHGKKNCTPGYSFSIVTWAPTLTVPPPKLVV
jgi:hypothetical protein